MNCPDKCLICGSAYTGGSVLPGDEMKEGLRVFFKCGSMSYELIDDCIYKVLIKCYNEDAKNELQT